MPAKTYESLSDIFDKIIRDENYTHIAKENADTFGNYKHNYIVKIINSNSKKIDVPSDLKGMEDNLIKREDLLIKIPLNLINKLDKINYSDIASNEKALISYLQENNSEDIPLEIFDTINHIKQDFDNALENYKEIYTKGELPNLDKDINYQTSPKIKECEYEAKDYTIKKGLWTLGNVIVNELISYNKEDILNEIGIKKEELNQTDNKEIIDKLHNWVYRTAIKYRDYSELFHWIAEGKEYEEKALGIKDYSDEEIPEEDKFELKRETLKIPLEILEDEKENEEEMGEKTKNIEKIKCKEELEEEQAVKKSFWHKVKSLFK